MIRRIGVMSFLGAAWAWLAIALLCGPVWTGVCPPQAETCCEHSAPAKPSCPADSCALTCATVLVAQLNEIAFDVAPRLEATRFANADFRAEASREPPPVPPPRAASVG